MTEPLPRSRATVLVQVLVAALFLAVIGGSAGVALGLRDRDGGSGGAQGAGATQGSGGTPGSGGVQSSATQGGGGTQGSGATEIGGPVGPSAQLPGDTCPDEATQQAGQGELAQVLYIRTANSEVWICRDVRGALYYQGHRFSDESWLFLSGVQRKVDEYVATNVGDQGTTYYRVSRTALVIENAAAGEPEMQPVVSASG